MVTFPTVRSCVVLLAIKVPVARKGPSRQTHLCLPVTSYTPFFNDVIEKTAEILEFILCQATLVAFDLFLHLALIVHEGLPHSAKRRRGRKTRSSSGEVAHMETSTISTLPVLADSVGYCQHFLSNIGHRRCPYQKTCDILCTLACNQSTLNIVCISGGMRWVLLKSTFYTHLYTLCTIVIVVMNSI